ncbi:unnamed protein product [Gadus morhua 'NCC']
MLQHPLCLSFNGRVAVVIIIIIIIIIMHSLCSPIFLQQTKQAHCAGGGVVAVYGVALVCVVAVFSVLRKGQTQTPRGRGGGSDRLGLQPQLLMSPALRGGGETRED